MEASGNKTKTGAVSSTDSASFGGLDVLLDMEISAGNRKRRRGSVENAENGKLDVHYLKFLEHLEDLCDEKFGVVDGGEKDEEDPDYRSFFYRLQERGNSYVCDLSVEDGVLSPIVYEEGGYSSEVKRKTARMRIGNHNGRKKWKLKQGGDTKLGKESYGAKNKSHGEVRKSVDVIDEPRSRVKNPDLGDDCAQVFKDGWKSTISSKDNHVKKNRSLDVDGDQKLGSKRSGLEKNTPKVDECYAKFIQNLHVKGEDVFWDCGDNSRIYYEPCNQQKNVSNVDLLGKRKRSQTSSPAPKLPSPLSKIQVTSLKESTTRDAENLHSAYDETPEKEEDYRKELCESLRKPYDQEEYDLLFGIISAQKPVSIYKDTRRGGYYWDGPKTKSYLDDNKDLRTEIENAIMDRGKVLNLLRMFFYHLQRLPFLQTVRGYTQPWKDDYFKSILPGSSNESLDGST